MENVEPVKALQLEPAFQYTFMKYFKTLPQKPVTTIRCFDRGEYFSVHGEDARMVSEEIFKSSLPLKTMNVEDESLQYICLSKKNFETLIRELLLVRQYRCEVYVNDGTNKDNRWNLEYKGSPGNISHFEDILFESGDAITNNIVMAIVLGKDNQIGMSCIDVNERLFSICEFMDNEFFSNLESLIVQIGPRECLIADSKETTQIEKILKRSNILHTKQKKTELNIENLIQDLDRLLYFEEGQHQTSRSINEIKLTLAMAGLHNIIKYLDLLTDDYNFNRFNVKILDTKKYVHLDSAALKALNILPKSHLTPKENSILGILDSCRTPQGHRLIAQWVKQPLRDMNMINDRLDAVEAFVNNLEIRNIFYENLLRKMPDLLMLSKRIIKKNAKLQQCYKIYQTVNDMPYMLKSLKELHNSALNANIVSPLEELCEDMQKFQKMIETTLDMDLADKGEFLVKASFDSELQDLKKKMDYLTEKVQKELNNVARDLNFTAGKNVKMDYTENLGYFFRVTLREEPVLRDKKEYIILGALKGGVRFVTGKMEKINDEYSSLKLQYEETQQNLVTEILSIAAGYANTLSSMNYIIAQLDVIVSLAIAAATAPIPYIRPKLHEEGSGLMNLKEIRHPCLEVQDGISYTPNDVEFKREKSEFHIITGPNMGGKSTYIRSIAVTALMAQIGSFVPCTEAETCIFDCIMTRVGADDDQTKGLSTFMVEMVETAAILRTATKNSLVVIDELGRGTSTKDGCAIAWSIAEHIAGQIKCFALFATHFHEITEIENPYPTVTNKQVKAVIDKNNMQLTFLYKVVPGICDQSFGVHVAKIVGFPDEFLQLAINIQHELEDYENKKHLVELDVRKRQQILRDSNEILMETFKKLKRQNVDNLSDEELLIAVKKIKTDLQSSDNLYVKSIFS